MHGCESTFPYHHYYQHHRHVLERRDEDFAENQLSRAVEHPTSEVIKVDLKEAHFPIPVAFDIQL